MKNFKIDNMIKGWFIGAFNPTAYTTNACEVAVKHYRSGEKEKEHYHKVATEITLVIMGQIYMAGQKWTEGDIIVLSPGEKSSFEALTDVISVVVKIPGMLNDKFLSG